MARATAVDLTADALFGEEPTIEGETPPEATGEEQHTESPPEPTPPSDGEGEGVAEPPATAGGGPSTGEAEEGEGEPEQPPVSAEPKQKFPWKELREAQKQRELLQAQLEAVQRERAAELARIQQAVTPQAQPGEQRPGIDRPYTQEELSQLRVDDPIEYATVLAEQAQRATAEQAQRAQLMAMQQMVASQVAEYKGAHPEYAEAAKYAGERERAAWVAVGLPDTAPPHHPRPDGGCCADHMVEARTAMLIQQSLQSGRNVAENVMAVAKAYGWQAAQPTPEPSPTVAPAPGQGPSPQERIAASKAKTVAAMGSIGNIPSGPAKATTRITAEQFKAMSESDMEKMDKENPNWMDYLDL